MSTVLEDAIQTREALLQEFLGQEGVPPPPAKTRLALLQTNMSMWQNSYFQACSNLRVAHEAHLVELGNRFFEEAKQMREAFQSAAKEVETLMAEMAQSNGHQL